MEEKEFYRIEKDIEVKELPFVHGQFLSNILIENQTGHTLVYIDRRGKTHILNPALYRSGYEGIVIHDFDKTGEINLVGYTNQVTEFKGDRYYVTNEVLERGPVYVESLNIHICLVQHRSLMEANRQELLKTPDEMLKTFLYRYGTAWISEQLRALRSTGRNYDIVDATIIIANNPHTKHDLYRMSDGLPVKVNMSFDENVPSFLAIVKGSNLQLYVEFSNKEFDWSTIDNGIVLNHNDRTYYFGSTASVTQSIYDSEMRKYVKESNEYLQLGEQLTTVKEELRVTKQKLSSTTTELKAALENSTKNHEIKMMRAKEDSESAKRIHERDQEQMKLIQDREKFVQERRKHVEEVELAELKNQKEKLSTKTAEVNATANNLKVAATVAPLILAAMTLAGKFGSSNTSFKLITTASSPTPIAVAIGAVGLAVAVYKMGKYIVTCDRHKNIIDVRYAHIKTLNALKYVKEFLGKSADSVWNSATGVVDAIKSGGKKAKRYFREVLNGITSSVVKTSKSIFKAGKNIMSKGCKIVSDFINWLF